jgi:ketosteroid isomerase-like protein
MNPESSNKNLMLSVVSAFRHGDMQPLLDAIAEDVVWNSNAPSEFFRFGGLRRGRVGVLEFTALMASLYQFRRFEPRLILAQGDVVWGQIECEARHLRSGRTVRYDLSMRWTVKDGKIVEHQGIFDTASVLMQQGDLKAA